jgi:hypothetical protein
LNSGFKQIVKLSEERKENMSKTNETPNDIWVEANPPSKSDLLQASVYDRFNAIFGGIYNIVELAIEDKEKVEKVKSLIGNVLFHGRTTICSQIENYDIR